MTIINIFCDHHMPLCTCTESPQAIPSGKVESISPGQDPDFDKQHADTHKDMRWPHKLLILVAGQSVCVIGVSKLWNCHFFLLDPALIKCAVKLTLFVQFRWKLVWMCMNDSFPLRYHITSHYVNTGIDSYRWTTCVCVCDRCVLAVKLTIDPPLLNVLWN